MLLRLSDEQQLLLESLDELLARVVTPEYVARIDREHRPPLEFEEAMAEAGFSMLGVPEEFGGTPIDNVTLSIISQRVARAGLATGYGSSILQVGDILEFGTAEQQKAIIDHLSHNTWAFCLGFTEPGAGSDNASLRTTAVHKNGKITFNGVKTLITSAQIAPYILLMARDPEVEDQRKAISMYLIPMDTPGISVSPIEKIAWHLTDTNEVFLDNVVTDESALVGVKGNGFKQLMRNFEMERIV